jgi:mono/diheme cytochrome c family protein
MKKLALLLPLLAFWLLPGCENSSATTRPEAGQGDTQVGFLLLESNCLSCHAVNPGEAGKVAPSLAAVKNAYTAAGGSRTDFIGAFAGFLKNPSAQMAKMPEAVAKYGLMPKMGFSDAQLEAVAAYVYDQAVETPEWATQQYPLEKIKWSSVNAQGEISWLDRGSQLAMATKSVLGKNLLNAINTEGTAAALTFCNTRAIPLTDSMSTALGARIRRVSDQARNPGNRASAEELAYIQQAKEQLRNGQEPKPELRMLEGLAVGYYPITTNKMCLQCHGQPGKDITDATHKEISRLYPEDQGVGYGENALRGIFVVEMKRD